LSQQMLQARLRLIKLHQSWHFAFDDNESQFDKHIYIYIYARICGASPLAARHVASCYLKEYNWQM
jgi:hypothetical protein